MNKWDKLTPLQAFEMGERDRMRGIGICPPAFKNAHLEREYRAGWQGGIAPRKDMLKILGE